MHDADEARTVLVNDAGQYSLWPARLGLPPGWRVAYSASTRRDCLDYVAEHWTDIRPRGPLGEAGARLHQLFAEQVARTPEAPALIWQDQCISYRKLHRRSQRLTRFLSRRGIGAGAHIGVCVERSPRMIAALFAIMQAGAAYVPLDPEYPVERLQYMLEHSGAEVLLTQRSLGPLFPSYQGEIVDLDEVQAHIDTLPVEPMPFASGADTAYVIYSSGSTGRPKGVLVGHRSLVNHSFAVNRHFRFGPGDRVLQCRPISFDAAAEEIFPPLLHGAALVLGSDPLRQTFRALTQQVIDTGTTFMSVPTAFWHSWVREEDCLIRLASESSLRLVIVAGEKVTRQALLTWKKRIGERIRWCNVYGPTEATITSTVFEPGADWNSDRSSSVPIGHPIENVRCHVLDDDMTPVPTGVVGELYLGGEGVAIGYLDAPGMTAESFVADPFSAARGKRLYRTGDLARTGADGLIEFVGRRDHQVKIRGYRIELGEIEAVAGEHPAVRQCVVVLDDSTPDNPSLSLHAVVNQHAGLSDQELLGFLRRKLPWYMIPAGVRFLAEMPVTPSGKIDRGALMSREAGAETDVAYIAPRTPAETALTAIWEELLGQRKISVDADFFQLGGHSLIAAGLISRIRAQLNVSVPVRVLFEHPTIASLAVAVTRWAEEGAGDS
ncbi:amino acid adenylation domain-containing protein [Streptomyces sp. TYQ1024]|nr:amino acid adenylation domain-containing protein [Streptomyces sp. TYQ1024]